MNSSLIAEDTALTFVALGFFGMSADEVHRYVPSAPVVTAPALVLRLGLR